MGNRAQSWTKSTLSSSSWKKEPKDQEDFRPIPTLWRTTWKILSTFWIVPLLILRAPFLPEWHTLGTLEADGAYFSTDPQILASDHVKELRREWKPLTCRCFGYRIILILWKGVCWYNINFQLLWRWVAREEKKGLHKKFDACAPQSYFWCF